MDRIYMNRIEGQRRIHVEIHENEVSDLLDDLKADPEHFASTRLFLGILRVAEEIFLPAVSETRRNREGAARTASGQQPETVPCGHCKGSGADPEDEGDYLPEVHRHNPFSVGPCPECNGKGTAVGQPADGCCGTDDPEFCGHVACPAVGQPAEAQATDEARPSRNRWQVETYDPLAEYWGPGTPREDVDEARDRLARISETRPTWSDGTPVERRLVRETTTWTVEDER